MDKWITPVFVLILAVCATGCRELAQEEYGDARPAVADVAVAAQATPAAEATTAVDTTPVPEDLLHLRFMLVRVDDKELIIEDQNQRPDIEFNEGFQISGHICNRYRGPAELKDGKLYAEKLASTMMLCINSELDELERLFFDTLRAGADISLTDDGMTLSQGGRVLSYTRADWMR